jgi:hypothetical protein
MATLGLALTLGGVTAAASADSPWSGEYESYFNYIGAMPDEAETNYSVQVQGIAHDSGNWFISQKWGLWRIPIEVNLWDPVNCAVSGVVCAHQDDLDTIGSLGYDHFGGIDHYQHDLATGFLLVPLEKENDPNTVPSIAAFNGTTLRYVDHWVLSNPVHISASWVAIGLDHRLYTSNNQQFGWVYVYEVDWDRLARDGELALEYGHKFALLDEGGILLELGPQGGVFSPGGNLLYITNGNYKEYDDRRDGISVFDMQTDLQTDPKRRIGHSSMAAGEPFWFGYAAGIWPGEMEEPEDLTIWDLDEDPRIGQLSLGQLHVLVLDLDQYDDDVYVRHYTDRIYVDRSYSGEELGDPTKPHNTVGEALAMAWDGARIRIRHGVYAEALTFSGRLQVYAAEGTATIGTGGRVSLSPSAAINLAESGMMRLD